MNIINYNKKYIITGSLTVCSSFALYYYLSKYKKIYTAPEPTQSEPTEPEPTEPETKDIDNKFNVEHKISTLHVQIPVKMPGIKRFKNNHYKESKKDNQDNFMVSILSDLDSVSVNTDPEPKLHNDNKQSNKSNVVSNNTDNPIILMAIIDNA
jgi:hypothetical protein